MKVRSACGGVLCADIKALCRPVERSLSILC